jgi:hypothetical protein
VVAGCSVWCQGLDENRLADVFEGFLAAPSGPLGLCDRAIAGDRGTDWRRLDPPVSSYRADRPEEPLIVEAVLLGQLDDVDVVAPAGAGDSAFEDSDALLGDRGFG